MRRVPLDKIFLQPSVHLHWLRLAGTVRFEVGAELAGRFGEVWRVFEIEGCPAPTTFLEGHSLSEDDFLFALFAGAVHARDQMPEFWVEIEPEAVVWQGAFD